MDDIESIIATKLLEFLLREARVPQWLDALERRRPSGLMDRKGRLPPQIHMPRAGHDFVASLGEPRQEIPGDQALAVRTVIGEQPGCGGKEDPQSWSRGASQVQILWRTIRSLKGGHDGRCPAITRDRHCQRHRKSSNLARRPRGAVTTRAEMYAPFHSHTSGRTTSKASRW